MPFIRPSDKFHVNQDVPKAKSVTPSEVDANKLFHFSAEILRNATLPSSKKMGNKITIQYKDPSGQVQSLNLRTLAKQTGIPLSKLIYLKYRKGGIDQKFFRNLAQNLSKPTSTVPTLTKVILLTADINFSSPPLQELSSNLKELSVKHNWKPDALKAALNKMKESEKDMPHGEIETIDLKVAILRSLETDYKNARIENTLSPSQKADIWALLTKTFG